MKPIFPKPETLNATPVTMEREAYQAALELGAGRPVDKDFADRCYASNTCAGAALATLAGKDADTPHAMIGFPRFAAALQSLVTMSGDKPYSRSTLEHAASVYPTARAAFKALSGEGAAPLDVKTAQMIFAEAVKAWEAAEAAMDKAGQPAVAPCTVRVTEGTHSVQLAKDGFVDPPAARAAACGKSRSRDGAHRQANSGTRSPDTRSIRKAAQPRATAPSSPQATLFLSASECPLSRRNHTSSDISPAKARMRVMMLRTA